MLLCCNKGLRVCHFIQHKVKLGFLPVGHTHEDIDQRFSCVSRQLSRRNALTIPGAIIVC